MKRLKDIITEDFTLKKKGKIDKYSCHPETYSELRAIVEERLAEDENANLNDIDISNITDMCDLFYNLNSSPHNIDISEWDVANVEDMYNMFFECENFNCDLSNWDVSKVKDMYAMFSGCKSFEGKGLENWDVTNVEDMRHMFEGCSSLKKNNLIPAWYKGVR